MPHLITTYTGRHFDITNMNPDAICIEDMAHALSLICRGNGHVKTFYSVGQHCLQCAYEAEARSGSPRLIVAALLHDGTECYMSDVPRPLKAVMPDYAFRPFADVEKEYLALFRRYAPKISKGE